MRLATHSSVFFSHFIQHLNSFGAVQTNVKNKTKSNQQLLLMYFCIQSRNNQDQFHNLSDCALCSLPFFLMVTGSSRKPPLTPFEATSCRETSWGAHSLKSHQAGEQYRNKGWSSLSQSRWFWVTYANGMSQGLFERQRFCCSVWSEIQAGADCAFFLGTYKHWMIRTGQIDGLMAFKWQGRLNSVPVCAQTM